MFPAHNSTPPSQTSFFLLVYKSKRLIIPRPTGYEPFYASIRQQLPEIPRNHKISFYTKDLDVCDGQFAEISKSSWDDVLPLLKSITVQVWAPSNNQELDGRANASASNRIELTLHSHRDTLFIIYVTPTTNILEIFAIAADRFNLNVEDVRLLFNGEIMPRKGTVKEAGFENGDVINCFPSQRGGKPVIYLHSPSDIMASVTLSLVRQWNFSAIYPVVPIKHLETHLKEELEWRVRVRPNGELTEMNTGLDVAYLFWEAHTDSSVPASPPQFPVMGHSPLEIEAFNPNDARLSDQDSIVIPVDTITLCLDAVLKALGLHTEARTSFITYWLPAILKHKHVALRFLPQSAYERAAPLNILPTPDVVTRVFMLFKGIDEELLSDWPTAQDRACDAVNFWKDVVGVDTERSLNESLFRVLEWGGMEVL